MPLTTSLQGGFDPNQAVGLQRSNALNRILHFENTMHRRLGNIRPIRYVRLGNYYIGQNLPPDNVEQPLGINLFKAICDKHVSYLWGQWQKKIVTFRVKPKNGVEPEDDTSLKIRGWIDDLWDANNRNDLLWKASKNYQVYGDAFFRLRWDVIERRVAIESILPEFVHCRWDVADMTRLTEIIVAYPMDRLDAQEQFGTTGNEGISYNIVDPNYLPGFAVYWEHWTTTSYTRWLDDVLISQQANPYMWTDNDGNIWPGIIPFVHVPNMRIEGEYYGFSAAESMLYMQDELNRRMADIGDTVNNHAHPIVVLNGWHGDQEDLPVGPDAVWDLGREGKAEILSWKGPPSIATEYIELLLRMIYDTSNMPEVSFGRSSRGSSGGGGKGGGGGQSGIALQLALMPIIERSTDGRIVWDLALRKATEMAAFMQFMQDRATLPFDYFDMRGEYEIAPVFSTILPRDRMQVVNEQVALVNSILRSRERALEELGEENIIAEEAKVWSDARKLAKLGLLAKPVPGGRNSDRGNGGSPSNPGGPGANQRKPGAPAKSA